MIQVNIINIKKRVWDYINKKDFIFKDEKWSRNI